MFLLINFFNLKLISSLNNIMEEQKYLINALDKSSYNVAKIVYELWKNEYVCTSITNNEWCQLVNDKWIPIQERYVLKIKLSEELASKYMKLSNDCFLESLKKKGIE